MNYDHTVDMVGVYYIEDDPDVYILELVINTPPVCVDVSSFTQKNDKLPKESWQAAFNEHYLNSDGTAVLGTFLDKDNLLKLKAMMENLAVYTPLMAIMMTIPTTLEITQEMTL